MPKERFHVFLASQLLGGANPGLRLDIPAFFVGAVSPDIFYYDLPFFYLSSISDRLHSLIEREGTGPIVDWLQGKPLEEGNSEAISWGLGLANHFMADALWHPLIEELSSEQPPSVMYKGAERLSTIERHRLLESEIEAFWFAKIPGANKKNYLPPDFSANRARLTLIFSHYRSFLDFVGRLGPKRSSTGPAPMAPPSEERITRCHLSQNFLLRLFASRVAGSQRNRLLHFPPTRSLGVLVTPRRPILPEPFSKVMPEERNPFSDFFMNRALDSMKAEWDMLLQRMSIKLP